MHQQNSPFILAVNSFEKRKNIPFIIDVFNVLRQQYRVTHNLCIVGRPNSGYGDMQKKIKQSPFRDSILTLQNISLKVLKDLYQNAGLFINASVYEGFGFTPLEAISMDCPAFVFPNTVCKELFGNHPCLIDSKNPAFWAEKIYSEMHNNFSNKIRYDSLGDLSWEKCALNFNNLLYSLLGAGGP